MSETRIIRTARKRHRCVNASCAERGLEWAASCARYIEPGQQYVQGDPDPYRAGGFGHDYICKPCADGGHA